MPSAAVRPLIRSFHTYSSASSSARSSGNRCVLFQSSSQLLGDRSWSQRPSSPRHRPTQHTAQRSGSPRHSTVSIHTNQSGFSASRPSALTVYSVTNVVSEQIIDRPPLARPSRYLDARAHRAVACTPNQKLGSSTMIG